MTRKIVCIGSSAAAVTCALQVKRLDPLTQVIILTKQTEKPNNTCFLVDYLAGRRDKESLYLPIPDDLTIIYDTQVIALDAASKKVVTANPLALTLRQAQDERLGVPARRSLGEVGSGYMYDKLFIAAGLQPRIPALFMPHLYKTVFPFKSLDDITLFEQHAHNAKRIVVVGGGVTGVEASEALAQRGYQVTLCEQNAQLLPNCTQPDIAQQVYNLLTQHGIMVMLNTTVDADMLAHYDLIFLAMGGTPATQFVNGQLILDNGYIVVNDAQQTSDPDIFAGGDVCPGRNLWPQAVRDGVLAAYGLVGLQAPQLKPARSTIHIRLFDTDIRY